MIGEPGLKVKLLNEEAWMPARGRPGDAAYDLYASETVLFPAGAIKAVGTSIAIKLPLHTAGLVVPRSGLALHSGLTVMNAPGLVDPNYRGEVKVILVNHSRAQYQVQGGDRIAQLLVVPYWLGPVEEAESLDSSERGAAGFGSSGR